MVTECAVPSRYRWLCGALCAGLWGSPLSTRMQSQHPGAERAALPLSLCAASLGVMTTGALQLLNRYCICSHFPAQRPRSALQQQSHPLDRRRVACHTAASDDGSLQQQQQQSAPAEVKPADAFKPPKGLAACLKYFFLVRCCRSAGSQRLWQALRHVVCTQGDGLDKARLKQLGALLSVRVLLMLLHVAEALAGVGAVASYGFISNLNYCTGLSFSWIAFVSQRHLSPLAPGQWKAFLAFYAVRHLSLAVTWLLLPPV